MADELAISILGRFAKGGRNWNSRDMGMDGVSVTVSGTDFDFKTQTLTTSAAVVGIGAITTPGYFFYRNLDATNNALFRNGSGGANLPMAGPGGIGCFQVATGATIYGLSSASTVEIIYCIIEA